MIPLACNLVDAVNVDRADRVVLVCRQVLRFAVYLTGAGKYDFNVRIIVPARLQDEQLGSGVYLEVGIRILHGIDMAGLTGKIKEVILALDQKFHRMLVAHIREIDFHTLLDGLYVEKVPSIFGNKAVYKRYIGTE